MNKNVLNYGLILGLVLSANMLVLVTLSYNNSELAGSEVVGYASMVVIFSLLFFGIRKYRNSLPGGNISFGKAFKAGALIALIASTIYVLVWLFYYYLFVPDYLEVYSRQVISQLSEGEKEAKALELENIREMYRNPLFVVLITYSEVLPVGLLVALISALVLKRNTPVPE